MAPLVASMASSEVTKLAAFDTRSLSKTDVLISLYHEHRRWLMANNLSVLSTVYVVV